MSRIGAIGVGRYYYNFPAFIQHIIVVIYNVYEKLLAFWSFLIF